MKVNFNGFNENVTTFLADTSVTAVGQPVKMEGNGRVAACGAGEPFCGVTVGVRDGYTAVQLVGYIRVQTASQLSVGYQKLAANAAGKVAANENGREYLVLDSDSGSAGIIL